MVNICGQGRSLFESDVIELEKKIGSSLPEKYRIFILKHNGGNPDPDTIYIEGLPGGGCTDIQLFFGIELPIESIGIFDNWASLKGRIPDRFLPVACDSGGWVFCVSLSGADRGNVVICTLTFDETDGTTYFVATDFDEFLERIVPFDEN